MKKILSLCALLFPVFMNAQHQCARAKQHSAAAHMAHIRRTSALSANISHELKYDVKFVHLMLNVERNTKYISGGVKTVATVTAAALDTFACVLHENLAIDSIRFNGSLVSFSRADSMVKVGLNVPLSTAQSFTTVIWYKGLPPVGGSAIGSGFSTGTSGAWGNQVTWSLSESVVAYHWWPCKQIITDKIDSSWVSITTDSLNMAGSNGLLKNVTTAGSKKTYHWQSRYPIAYYLISVAVAKYKEYNIYAKPLYFNGDSILIQNFIYDNAINSTTFNSTQKVQLNKMPQVLALHSKLFGMYPFAKEKYGHCMAPFGGGMEHQTMTSLGFFDYYLDAHELGHQWWGDNVTCKSWGDIWINEGFASYSEHLTAQYLDPANFASNLNSAHNSVMNQPDGSIYFTGPDTMDANRIFDSRLTYDKGGAILHTLRFITNNDSLFFNMLRGFQNTYKDGTASTLDFQNYYQSQTGIDPTQFFNQWYYGEGYPTFTVKYNTHNNILYIKNTQTTSKPSSVPLFITPIEYKLTRSGAPDTIVKFMHSNAVEIFTLALTGTVTGITTDPNNYIINKVIGQNVDPALVGVEEYSDVSGKISAGPNPTRGALFVQNVSGPVQYELLDANGKQLNNGTVSKDFTLDMNNHGPGIYFLQLKDETGRFKALKVIKL